MATQSLIFVLVACVLAQGFFVASEVALSACDRGRLRTRAAGGARRAARVERMLAVPQVTLATTLVGANLATLIAVLAIGLELVRRGDSPLWAPLLVVPPLLVLGHLVPKTIVTAQADRLVELLAAPLQLMSFLLRPIIAVVGAYAALLTRLTRTDRKKAFVTRDELALMIESEPETDKPEIGSDEREMIANVFELSEYKVGELMVPLSEITALPEDALISEAALEVADKQHSRMPIYRSRIDDVVGIVHMFDILQAASKGDSDKPVAALAHPPTYVPETMKASDLLVQLQTEQTHLAIVVNEYGSAVASARSRTCSRSSSATSRTSTTPSRPRSAPSAPGCGGSRPGPASRASTASSTSASPRATTTRRSPASSSSGSAGSRTAARRSPSPASSSRSSPPATAPSRPCGSPSARSDGVGPTARPVEPLFARDQRQSAVETEVLVSTPPQTLAGGAPTLPAGLR